MAITKYKGGIQFAQDVYNRNKDPDQVAVDAFARQLQFNASTLTEADFRALALNAAYNQSAQSTSLGLTLPALPAGLTAQVTKPTGSNLLTIVVTKNGKSSNATSTITQFAADPNEKDTRDLLALLRQQTTTSLTEVDFKKLVIGVALFSQSIATQLGIGTLPSFNGVKVFARKDATEALVHLSMSKGSFAMDGQIDVTKFASPPVDTSAQDQADVDNFASQVRLIDTSTLTESQVNSVILNGNYNKASNSTSLGITLPTLPTGMTATISKGAPSANFTVIASKNGKTATASPTITHFATPVKSQDEKDVDADLAKFAALTTTSLTKAAFDALKISGKAMTQAVYTQLGLPGTIPTHTVPTFNMNKNATGDSYELQGVKGSINKIITITMTSFAPAVDVDQKDVDETLARFLAIDTSSFNEDDFNDIVISGKPFTQAIADQLGIGTLPAINSGVSVNMNKSSMGNWIAVQVIKGTANSGVKNAVVTKFGSYSTDQVAMDRYLARLDKVYTSGLTMYLFNRDVAFDFTNKKNEDYDIPTVNARYKTVLPTLTTGLTGNYRKPVGYTIYFTLTKGSVKVTEHPVEFTAFAYDPTEKSIALASDRFAKFRVTRLTESAFTGVSIPAGTAVTQSLFDTTLALGTMPPLATGESATASKAAGSNTVTFTVTNGTTTISTDVKIATYGSNVNQQAVNYSAQLLMEVHTTTIDKATFLPMTQAYAGLTPALEAKYGFTAPTLIAGVGVSISKFVNDPRIGFRVSRAGAYYDQYITFTNFPIDLILIGGGQSNMGLVGDANTYPASAQIDAPVTQIPVQLMLYDHTFQVPTKWGGSYNISHGKWDIAASVFQHIGFKAGELLGDSFRTVYGISASHSNSGFTAPDTGEVYNQSPRGKFFSADMVANVLRTATLPFNYTDPQASKMLFVWAQGEVEVAQASNAETSKTHKSYVMTAFYMTQEMFNRTDMPAVLGTMKKTWVGNNGDAKNMQAETRSLASYNQVEVADNDNINTTDDAIFGSIHFGPTQMEAVGENYINAYKRVISEPYTKRPLVAIPADGAVLLDVSAPSARGAFAALTAHYIAYNRETNVTSDLRDLYLYRQYESDGTPYYRLKYELFGADASKKLTIVTEQNLNPLFNHMLSTDPLAKFKIVSVDDQTGTGFTIDNIGIDMLRDAKGDSAIAMSAGKTLGTFQFYRTDGNTVQGQAVSADGTKSFPYQRAKISIIKR